MVKRYEVIITTPAEKDFYEVLNYFISEISVCTAENVQIDFVKQLNKLGVMPTAYGILRIDTLDTEYTFRRIFVRKKYQIIYRIEESIKTVYVLRILHVRKNFKKL